MVTSIYTPFSSHPITSCNTTMVDIATREGRPKRANVSTMLHIVILAITFFVGYMTGLNKQTVLPKANCNQFISTLLGHEGGGAEMLNPFIIDMRDKIESAVDERVMAGYYDCFGLFNLKFLFYFMQMQNELQTETKGMTNDKCLARISSVLEEGIDGSDQVEMTDAEKRSIELIMANAVRNHDANTISKEGQQS